jgi:queuine/archaeosine tRNA-ribosyltransferase
MLALLKMDSQTKARLGKLATAHGIEFRSHIDGHAIGSVSVGEPEPEMLRAVEFTKPFLPAHKARYATDPGTPAQMVELIARAVAEHGGIITLSNDISEQARRFHRLVALP